ncbi:MAG TPA: serine/threonine-protein kinase [Deltaproteobacteria bacterium]|nr:serine/threonine-protein kinase [Deltaproteobacteria bacterium]
MNYGRYEIVRELGKGSMGVVYQAHDPQIGRTIALKVLRPDRVSSEDFVQRFLKEARAIGRMSHQNIVTVYDVGQDQSTVYIAMEFLEGEALNAYARDRTLTMEQIIDIGIQVADSLDYAHTRGIVHRDIKPQNIMVAPTGVVKLTDFGIAHVEDPEASHQTQAGEILGTPNYMSPEQVMGKKVDGRSDLYSLGVILYELATGSRPFKGENLAAIFHAITSETPARPEALNPQVPKGLSGVILRCLEKNPEERFRTGRELSEALRAILSTGEEVKKAGAGKRKGLLVMILAALAAACVIAAVVFFMATGKKEPPVDMGSLQVSSNPAGAQVYVDGNLKGTAPMALELPVGGHEVRLSMPGHYEWEARVQVDKEGGEPLTVELIPVEE